MPLAGAPLQPSSVRSGVLVDDRESAAVLPGPETDFFRCRSCATRFVDAILRLCVRALELGTPSKDGGDEALDVV